MEDLSFWVGLMIAIPLAIFANLVTPIVKRKIDGAGEKKLKAKRKTLEEEYNQIQNYLKKPSLLTSYLISIVIKTTFVGAFVGIIAGVMQLFRQWLDGSDAFSFMWDVHDVFNFILIIISVSVSVVIFQLCGDGIRAYNRVNRFEEYKVRYQKQIEEIDKAHNNGN